MSDPIYLDHNATTPLAPEVVDAMLPYLREHFGNPSSGHVFGSRAQLAVDEARAKVAAAIGASPDEIVFTSGGTEANNLAIRGVMERATRTAIVTSTVEHPATAMPCAWLEARGAAVTRVPVDGDGRVRIDHAARAIGAEVALVTVMHANNETGVIQPIAELASLARAAGALVHTDAAQSLGKVPLDVRALDVDLLSIAGHKLYAPKGVGALYVRRGTPLAPFALGAGHERGLRPGTENVASLVGLGVACELVRRELDTHAEAMRARRDALFERLAAAIPGLVAHGAGAPRLPNTLHVRFPNATGESDLARSAGGRGLDRIGLPRRGNARVGGRARDGDLGAGRARLGAAHARTRHHRRGRRTGGGRVGARVEKRARGMRSRFPFREGERSTTSARKTAAVHACLRPTPHVENESTKILHRVA